MQSGPACSGLKQHQAREACLRRVRKQGSTMRIHAQSYCVSVCDICVCTHLPAAREVGSLYLGMRGGLG